MQLEFIHSRNHFRQASLMHLNQLHFLEWHTLLTCKAGIAQISPMRVLGIFMETYKFRKGKYQVPWYKHPSINIWLFQITLILHQIFFLFLLPDPELRCKKYYFLHKKHRHVVPTWTSYFSAVITAGHGSPSASLLSLEFPCSEIFHSYPPWKKPSLLLLTP